MRTPDKFLSPTAAAKQWGFSTQWLHYNLNKFKDEEIMETPIGRLFSAEGMLRVFGAPDFSRAELNARKGRRRKKGNGKVRGNKAIQ